MYQGEAEMSEKKDIGSNLELLYETILKRMARGKVKDSYTAQILDKGTNYIAQKVGEEVVELVIAAVNRNKKLSISESADVLYHMLVLWASIGITPSMISSELESRQKQSGIQEKNSRNTKAS